jgi:hypothetical protein
MGSVHPIHDGLGGNSYWVVIFRFRSYKWAFKYHSRKLIGSFFGFSSPVIPLPIRWPQVHSVTLMGDSEPSLNQSTRFLVLWNPTAQQAAGCQWVANSVQFTILHPLSLRSILILSSQVLSLHRNMSLSRIINLHFLLAHLYIRECLKYCGM